MELNLIRCSVEKLGGWEFHKISFKNVKRIIIRNLFTSENTCGLFSFPNIKTLIFSPERILKYTEQRGKYAGESRTNRQYLDSGDADAGAHYALPVFGCIKSAYLFWRQFILWVSIRN